MATEKFGAGGKLRTTKIVIPRHVGRITKITDKMIDRRRLLILLRIGIDMDVQYRITNHFLKKIKNMSHKPNYMRKYHPSVKKTQTQKHKKNKTFVKKNQTQKHKKNKT